jgi:hypothetical protein
LKTFFKVAAVLGVVLGICGLGGYWVVRFAEEKIFMFSDRNYLMIDELYHSPRRLIAYQWKGEQDKPNITLHVYHEDSVPLKKNQIAVIKNSLPEEVDFKVIDGKNYLVITNGTLEGEIPVEVLREFDFTVKYVKASRYSKAKKVEQFKEPDGSEP